MTRHPTETWSIARSLAFLAATFAIVFGSLLPFAAMAATVPGHPIVICSAEGPQTIQVGGDLDGPAGKAHPAKCAACVMALVAAIPTPPTAQAASAPVVAGRADWTAASVSPPPPSRAPPRPPSTAPPRA